MANNNSKNSLSRVKQIFNDLDNYRNFCREHGFRFDEADLYSQRSYVYRQFQKFITGKPVKNQWEIDRVKFKEQAANRYRG
jgi:hypothetical protein